MKIINRDGVVEILDLVKIIERINKAKNYCGKNLQVDADIVSIKVIKKITDNITTTELDDITGKACINLSMDNPDWGFLGSRIIMSNHKKNVKVSFSEAMENLYYNQGHSPMISHELINIIRKNKEYYDDLTDMYSDNDYLIDYFGFKTLERSYFLRDVSGKIWETPQYLFMRVAIGIWGSNLMNTKETFLMFSNKEGVHATPTLFNSGSLYPSLSSCFLLGTDDSIDKIFDSIKDCAMISKRAGGIGIHLTNVRPRGSYIEGTGGKTDGIVPLMKVLNSTARYVNQCFTPDTIIYTNKGTVEIQNINTSIHKVITSNGKYKKINNVFKNEIDKNILKIFTISRGNIPIKCTDVHEILVLPTHEIYEKTLEYTKTEEFELKVKSYMKPTDDNETKMIYSKFVFDEYFQTQISKFDIRPIWKEAKNIIKGDMLCYPNNIENRQNMKFSSEIYTKMIDRDNFRDYGVHIENINQTNNENILEILEMIMDDNKRDFESEISNVPNNRFKNVTMYTMNKKTADNITMAFMLIGQLVEISEMNGGGVYEIKFPRNKFFQNFCGSRVDEFESSYYIDEYICSMITNIENEQYKGFVYDLNVDVNHNYLTSHGIVHNSGKRLGSIAVYIEPWHGDIMDFLAAMKTHGHEETLARDLYYAIWMPDLFMKQLKKKGKWYTFCSKAHAELNDLYGDDFEDAYNQKVNDKLYIKEYDVSEIWEEIIKMQKNSGMPYICYKDSINRKSNQKNIGTIKSSNLCVAPETLILTKEGEFEIKTLENKPIHVWNGEEWSETIVYKTGENQELIKVIFNNNSYIECTKYHRFHIETAKGVKIIDACNLVEGMKIINYKLPDKIVIVDYIRVIKIIETGRISDTYCFTESKRGTGIFNGILTGQCAEIMEYSDSKETAVCNLASIRLQTHLKPSKNVVDKHLIVFTKNKCEWCDLLKIFLKEHNIPHIVELVEDSEIENFKSLFNNIYMSDTPVTFPRVVENGVCIGGFTETVKKFRYEINFESLKNTVFTLVKNLNQVIDVNFYPTENGKTSNLRHRPIGIGVQGLADMFAKMWIPFESDDASEINKILFEAIYFYAVTMSMELAKIHGPYDTFQGSPMSKGIFQFDMWNGIKLSGLFDWSSLRNEVITHGVRNSLLIALMPTASTAQIMESTESFEPFNSCIYLRRTLSGEFLVINRFLIRILIDLNLWNDEMKQRVIYHRGSIQKIKIIPRFVKDMFKTVWEIKKSHLVNMSADRGAFVCQGQSFNIYIEKNDDLTMTRDMTQIHMYGWKKGLKTGSYYIRTKPAANPQSFTLDPNMEKQFLNELQENENEICINCGA